MTANNSGLSTAIEMLPDNNESENQRNEQPGDSTIARLLAHVSRTFPPSRWSGTPIVVGVSGGADSVALLSILRELRDRQSTPLSELVVAHCNYGMRAAESNGDAEFVRALAGKFGFRCEIWQANQLAKPGGEGWESHFRTLRYDFFEKLAAEIGARYVVVGHTRDDQAETVLFRILRGTSLSGLRGIPAIRRLNDQLTLFRPLLEIGRDDLLHYLAEHGLEFRVDSSNQSPAYTRNRIRNDLIPFLERQFNSDLRPRLVELAAQAHAAQQFIDSAAMLALESASQIESVDQVTIFGDRIAKLPFVVVRQSLVLLCQRMGWPQNDMTYQRWTELAEFVLATPNASSTNPPATINLPGNLIARRKSHGTTQINRVV